MNVKQRGYVAMRIIACRLQSLPKIASLNRAALEFLQVIYERIMLIFPIQA